MSSNEETMSTFNYHEINLPQGCDLDITRVLLGNSNYKIKEKLNIAPEKNYNVFHQTCEPINLL